MVHRLLSGSEIGIEQVLDRMMAVIVQIHNPCDSDEILKTIVSEVREILGSDRALIYRFLPDGDGVIAEESVNPQWKPILGQLIYDPCFNAKWTEQYQRGRVGILEDIDAVTLDPCYKNLLNRLQVRANLVVPILVRSPKSNPSPHLWGLLIVHQCSSPCQWHPIEIKFLQHITLQLGIAIEQNLKVETALRESEERYRSVIAAMAEGIVLQQADGKITACNQSAERILGLTAEQMMGRTSLDPRWRAIHEDGSPFPGEIHPSMVTLRTGEPQLQVVMGVHKPDGSLTWISINSQPLFYADRSQPYAVVTSFTDITVPKQAQQALQQQTERERMIYQIAQRIRQSLDLDEILNRTVAEVRDFLQTDRAIVYRFNPDWSGLVVKESVAEGWLAILNMQITDTYFVERQNYSYHESSIKATSDIYTAGFSPCHVDLLERLQVRAKLVVPILQGNRLWGLLVAHHCRAPRDWHCWESELLKQLATQIAIAIHQSELHQQLQLANQQLENLATIDQLTQIANRRCFDRQFRYEWHRLTREQQPLSLLLCDIDYFKQYNDTYGHAAGDVCLTLVAEVIKNSVQRSTDLAVRYGGEEFAVILPNTERKGAVRVAQKIWAAMKQLNLPHLASGGEKFVTLSIGIATMIPTADIAPVDLVEAADRALYQAKANGRNCWFTEGF